MGTALLTKFNHEEYWTEEYEKFNALPRDGENTNLFNMGTRDNPDLVMYKFKKQHNNLTDEEWRKLSGKEVRKKSIYHSQNIFMGGTHVPGACNTTSKQSYFLNVLLFLSIFLSFQKHFSIFQTRNYYS